MVTESQIKSLRETLITGNRERSLATIRGVIDGGLSAEEIITDLLWPVYESIETDFREDRLGTLPHRLASRLLRVIADRVADGLRHDGTGPGRGRTVFAVCGPTDPDELGAQMAVDMLGHYGFSVRFAGGGIPADEIQATVQGDTPDVLLMLCSAPADLPVLRGLIDSLHEIGACPRLQIVVAGGVFNRAEGLAEEIGADLWAEDPLELVQIMIDERDRRAGEDQRTVGRRRNIPRAA